jgi:hypothetical protein
MSGGDRYAIAGFQIGKCQGVERSFEFRSLGHEHLHFHRIVRWRKVSAGIPADAAAPTHAAPGIRILPDCGTRLIQIKLELKRLVPRIDFLDEAGRNEFHALVIIGGSINVP